MIDYLMCGKCGRHFSCIKIGLVVQVDAGMYAADLFECPICEQLVIRRAAQSFGSHDAPDVRISKGVVEWLKDPMER